MPRPPDSPPRPLAIDLFSGAGGFALGFEQAGFDVVAALEYDPIHAAVHEFNFPNTAVVCDDAATVEIGRIVGAIERGRRAHGHEDGWDGQLHAVFGGPPCQGFSTMGKRAADDARNRLTFAFASIVRELRPAFFALENVPGMPSAPGTGDRPLLQELLARFRRYGYRVLPHQIVNAASFGVPQDRRRLILLGVRSDVDLAKPLAYPDATHAPAAKLRGMTADLALPVGPTVRDAIGDLPNLDDFEELLYTDERRLADAELASLELAASGYVQRLRGREADPNDYSHPRVWDSHVLTSSHRTVHTPEVVDRFDLVAQGDVEAKSHFLRLREDGLSCTLRAGTGYDRGSFNAPRPIHPWHPRVISVREAARLHSFPDWFRLHWTKWHGFRQVGNALPPLLARAVAAQVREAAGLVGTKPIVPVTLGDPDALLVNMTQAADRLSVPLEQGPHHGLRTRGSGNAA